MGKYSKPTGEVFIRNYDEGVMAWFGATVQTVSIPPAGVGAGRNAHICERSGYFVDIAGANPTKVPVIWNNPEQIYEQKIYPSYQISRDSVTAAMQRWHSVLQLEYVAGVSGTEEVIQVGSQMVSGFRQIEKKAQAIPYDISYTISAYARYEHEALPMLKHILRRFPPYSRIFVIDSLGDSRSYTVFSDSDVQDNSEYVDVADRLKSYSISIRVEGELDLADPVVLNTAIDFQTSIEKQ